MPHGYWMDPQHPCPACGGTHYYTARNVPQWDNDKGARFRVKCPETGATVEVEIPALSPPPERIMTDTLCTTCMKALFYVYSTSRPVGSIATQRLRCSNEGCDQESMRKVDLKTGQVVVEPAR